ncbi:hypothetical protein B0H14DRAFT_2595497 [Mycena olivaceomarginata]|nr:hypothetical protein B0H14DRAFT_2595497 [Mycena olivaceomarginata]
MRFFSSSFPVLFLGLFAAASPVPAVDITDSFAIIASLGLAGQLTTSSIVPLLDNLMEALNTATAQLSGNVSGDQGANNEDLANLITEILDVNLQDINTAPNRLVPKLGLDGLPTPADTTISDLLTSLDVLLVPGLLAALQPLFSLVGLGGIVGWLLVGLNLARLDL